VRSFPRSRFSIERRKTSTLACRPKRFFGWREKYTQTARGDIAPVERSVAADAHQHAL